MIFPALSVAEHETFEVPSGKIAPDGGEQDASKMPELSFAEKDQDATSEASFPFVGDFRRGLDNEYGGQVKVGDVVSVLEIEN